MAWVTINGRECEMAPGTTILEAAEALGIEIPTLCHDVRLEPSGACRLCLVELKDQGRHVTACNTPVGSGMTIETHSPAVEGLRKTLLGLLGRNFPAGLSPDSSGKPFSHWMRHYRVGAGAGQAAYCDASHPYLWVDMARCINCFRCVRICNEVQGENVWQTWGRGSETRILPGRGGPLVESGCVSCGACSDTCPTGAIEDKSVLALGPPLHWQRTICPYCGVGCEMNVGTRNGRIVQVKPAIDSPVNKGHLCVKGRYAYDFVHASDRVTEPMIRRNGEWEKVTWPEAIQEAASGFRKALQAHGPEYTGVLGSARATNEENYLAQKFARVVLGTNNVDCCARVCHAPTAAGMKAMLGTGAATNSFEDIERASCFLICGCNPMENHPIVGARIRQAALRGARLVIIDPRRIELADCAALHLPLRPGTNIPLLHAMAHVLIEEKLYDGEAVRLRVRGWEEFQKFIAGWPPEKAAKICEVDSRLIREAARLYAVHPPAMCFHGLGVTEHVQGTEEVMCLVNLALLTGNIGKPGGGINPLRGQNNVQGAAHMGCEPASLTGFVALEQARGRFESAWDAPLPRTPGRNLMEMIDAAATEGLKALLVMGYDIALTNPNESVTATALGRIGFIVVQDLFLNELARKFGHVFLPACSSFEKEGTFMNAERRVQRVRKVIEPVGNSRPDWTIICDLARAMGHSGPFAFDSPEKIWDEVRQVWPAGAGMSYSRLAKGGLQWPCPEESHAGTAILHVGSFASGDRAALQGVEFIPSPEKRTRRHPFLLVTGRTLYQFNSGTMTMRTPNARLRKTDMLDISPHDAKKLGLEEGEEARVRSRFGETILAVHIDPRLRPGTLFATFHTAEACLNRLTGPYRDRRVQTPEYKLVAVNVRKREPVRRRESGRRLLQ